MPRVEFQRVAPFARAAVFDIVADVESYPEFVPGWRRARVLRREDERLLVEQKIGIGLWSWRFRTRATLDPPRWIRITSDESPFRRLDQVWRFRQPREDRTEISLTVDYELRGVVLRHLATGLFDEGFRRTLEAFENRVRTLLEAPAVRAGK